MWEKILSKKFDDIDIKLINILNKDGRINDQKIADILGISKTSVRMRRLKLQNSGAIKIIGLLVLQNMDLNYADILIKFVPNSKNEEIENFIEKCKNDEYIYEITRYIGYYDLLLRFFDEDFLRLKNHLYEIISNEKIIQEIIVVPVMMSDKAWGNIINFKDKK
ncbi:MAG: Lrp/AsnC family transcriptional regulator [Thermoplasmata archaeon]